VVRIVAAGETGPLFKEKTANSCYLLHWYILLVSLAPGADCDTGAPGIGKKTQCALLCQKLGFQHISLDDVLREKSDDPTYPHAEFVKDCLEEKVDVPKELTISLLERKINEEIEEGKKWSLVRGFPECIQELLEFEEKVGLTDVNKPLLTSSRCKKQITLYFSTAQLRGCSSV
jgi:adenylate kinase family enzyme